MGCRNHPSIADDWTTAEVEIRVGSQGSDEGELSLASCMSSNDTAFPFGELGWES
jgi:hypothetical protein